MLTVEATKTEQERDLRLAFSGRRLGGAMSMDAVSRRR